VQQQIYLTYVISPSFWQCTIRNKITHPFTTGARAVAVRDVLSRAGLARQERERGGGRVDDRRRGRGGRRESHGQRREEV
jgi:hypothetical protein